MDLQGTQFLFSQLAYLKSNWSQVNCPKDELWHMVPIAPPDFGITMNTHHLRILWNLQRNIQCPPKILNPCFLRTTYTDHVYRVWGQDTRKVSSFGGCRVELTWTFFSLKRKLEARNIGKFISPASQFPGAELWRVLTVLCLQISWNYQRAIPQDTEFSLAFPCVILALWEGTVQEFRAVVY